MRIYNTGKKDFIRIATPIIKEISLQGIVVDIGCGTGDLARYFASKFKMRFIGIDPHKKTLETARLKNHNKNLEFLQNDPYKFPFKTGFVDFCYAHEVIEHIVDDEKFVKELNRIMKKGSYCILTTPNRNVVPLKGANPDHKRHYTPKEIEKLLAKNGFLVTDITYRWNRLSRLIDQILSSLNQSVYKTKDLQPCVVDTVRNNKKKTLKISLFLYDLLIDPLIELLIFLNFYLTKYKEGYNMMVMAKKIKNGR